MIAALIRWSIKNRGFVLLALLFVVGGGVYSMLKTPVDAIPDLSPVEVIIKTPYPGQAPQVVQDQVTYPLETAMLGVPHSTTVRGFSMFGVSYVYVIFQDGTDLYWARSRVLEYLDQISGSLPANAHPTLGPDATGVGWVYEYALVDKTGQHNLAQLTSLQDWFLKYQLQTVQGVAEVATLGGMVKQYQVVVEPDKLRAYGITLAQVKTAIQNANDETSGGVIELGEAEYMVRTNGYITGIKDLLRIPLKTTPNGTPVRLKDVGYVRLGPEMRRGIAELNGQGDVVGGIIVMRSGANPQKVIDGVKSKLASLKGSLPPGVKIVPTYDRSKLIARAVSNLHEKLLEELIVVVLLCGLFLFHLRSSLVAIVSIPAGVLMAFIVMYLQGIEANLMSLAGIAIAIGAMSDGAIVMIENLHKHITEHGGGPRNHWQTVSAAAVEMGPPLFFSLMIITLSVAPVLVLTGKAGKMFSPLAYTWVYAMGAAAILAVTLIPVLMGYFVRGRIMAEHRNPVNRVLHVLYEPVINRVVRHPWVLLVVGIVIIASGVWPATRLGSEFMPTLDEGDLLYMPSARPGISPGKARQVLQQTDKLIMTVPEVKSAFGKMGRAQTATDNAPLTMIGTVIQFKPKSEWPPGVTEADVRRKLKERVKLPGLTNAWVYPIQTRINMISTGIKTPVGIKVSGPDLAVIQKIGKKLEQILPAVRGTTSVFSDRAVGGRYIQINIDRDKAARLGLNISNVEAVVQSAVGGMNVTETVQGLKRYPVNIRYPRAWRNSLARLRQLPIVTARGAHITLGDVASVRITNGPPMIKSEEARLTGWTYVDIAGRDLGSWVAAAKRLVARKIKLPQGYTLAWSGQYQFLQRAMQSLKLVAPLVIALVALLLYLAFRSVPLMFIILGTLPMAFAGGVWLLYFLQYNLSVAVAVGFIALAGLTVEIGVVLVVYLNQSVAAYLERCKRESQPLRFEGVRDAVRDGALLRLRPISMTVAAIIVGLLPIMLGSGTGASLTRHIAAPMIGGIVSSLVLTMLVLPAVYLLWKWGNVKKVSG